MVHEVGHCNDALMVTLSLPTPCSILLCGLLADLQISMMPLIRYADKAGQDPSRAPRFFRRWRAIVENAFFKGGITTGDAQGIFTSLVLKQMKLIRDLAIVKDQAFFFGWDDLSQAPDEALQCIQSVAAAQIKFNALTFDQNLLEMMFECFDLVQWAETSQLKIPEAVGVVVPAEKCSEVDAISERLVRCYEKCASFVGGHLCLSFSCA